MSDSSLRSVAPIHLQYLHNMGVRASASISIVKDDRLWGLIACHHDTPRLMTFDVRATCRALAGALARQIRAKEGATSYRQRIRLRGLEDEIVRMLSKEESVEKISAHHLHEVSRMLHADGVAVLQSAELAAGGVCPSEQEIRTLAAWIVAHPADGVIATDHLAELCPPAEAFRSRGSGLLALTVSAEMPWLLLWFRAEQIETINWAGNPHRFDASDPAAELRPRASFEAWQETVRGRARPWTLAEVDSANRLRSALMEVRQTRKMHALNRHLTGILRDKDVLLEQKEALVQEVNHRVQNSLQLVSSFLSLQARTSRSIEVHAALEEAGRRLHAVGLVHRRLYRGDQIYMINTARYIEELCADATSSMGQEWEQYLSLDLAPMTLSTDRAVTLGLVLTEQIININKHAYAGEPGRSKFGLPRSARISGWSLPTGVAAGPPPARVSAPAWSTRWWRSWAASSCTKPITPDCAPYSPLRSRVARTRCNIWCVAGCAPALQVRDREAGAEVGCSRPRQLDHICDCFRAGREQSADAALLQPTCRDQVDPPGQ